MKLYTYFRSSSSFRVRIALNLKGLSYEPEFIHLVKGEQKSLNYRGLNPQGLIPALEVDGDVLSQSIAIIEYLEDCHPDTPLLPTGALARARVRSMVNLVTAEIQPLNNIAVLHYLKSPLGHDQAEVDKWYDHWVSRGFSALEEMVKSYGGLDGFCYGGSVTMADVFFYPQIWNARRFNCDVSQFPNLLRVEEHLSKIDAFIKASPENQPDAE
jgi:maleylacetoacetate isomerase/maleylpyruvate isomerase